ncbi:MAG: hypothetical protein ABI539_15680 [Acidobacteriota bacterium]
MLKLAERYGQSPETVENWDEHWYSRACELAAGESLHEAEREKERLRHAKARRR